MDEYEGWHNGNGWYDDTWGFELWNRNKYEFGDGENGTGNGSGWGDGPIQAIKGLGKYKTNG